MVYRFGDASRDLPGTRGGRKPARLATVQKLDAQTLKTFLSAAKRAKLMRPIIEGLRASRGAIPMDADDYAEEKARADRRARVSICAEAVQCAVNAVLGEDDRKKPIGRSLYSYLLWEMTKAASDYASAENIDPVEFENGVLNEGLAVVGNLRSALIRDWSDKSLDFWDSQNTAVENIKAHKVPYIDRSSLETVTGAYLALPYRSQAMDRFLVQVLVEMEFYAYGDEMLNEKTFGLFPARSPLKQRHVLLAYLRGLIFNGVLFGGIAASALWASSRGWVSESGAPWIYGICIFLFLLFGAIGILALPFAWQKQTKARQHVLKLLSTMLKIYNELRSDGPISALYVRERVVAASQEGVVWPSPLFALLDDIISRTGRF
jgi:hypothetical protein